MEKSEKKVLILGLGNVLLNDEGIGVRSVEEMQKMDWPEYVDLLDGGTGGFVLLSLFQKYNHLIIIDATLSDDDEGTISVLTPKYANDFPKSLSTHELGLKDLIESATLLDNHPIIHLVTVAVNAHQDMDMKVSDKIVKKIPEVIQSVKQIMESISI